MQLRLVAVTVNHNCSPQGPINGTEIAAAQSLRSRAKYRLLRAYTLSDGSSTPKSVFLLLSESTRQTLGHRIDAHPAKSIDRRSSRHRHSSGPRSSFPVLRDLDTNRLDRRQSFLRP